MIHFREWLDGGDRHWREFFTGLWNLRDDPDGLSKSVAGFDTGRLLSTSEFQSLPDRVQQTVVNRIQQGDGTIADLVDIVGGGAVHDSPLANPLS